MDDYGDSSIKSGDDSSDLVLDCTTFSIWAIYKGIMVKVPNIDRHKRPALRFRQMNTILEHEYDGKTCKHPCSPQQGYQLRSSKIIFSRLLHTSPSKDHGTHPCETLDVVKDVNVDHSGENNVDNSDLILSGLTLKQIQNISKARVRGASFPNFSSETSGSNANITRCDRGIKRSCLEKFEDDSDLHETLGSWREKVSGRMSKARRRFLSPKQISFSMHEHPAKIKVESPTILKHDSNAEDVALELKQNVAESSVSVCDSVVSVSVEHLSIVEVKTEGSEVYHSEGMNLIVDNKNQNDLCSQPFKLIDVTTEGVTPDRGLHTSTGKPSGADVTLHYEECLSHKKSGNQIECSPDASPETCPEASDHASSTTPDINLHQVELESPLMTMNDMTEMYDAPVDSDSMVSANNEIVNAVDSNLAKSPEDLQASHVHSELRAAPLGEKTTPELGTICTEQYCDIDVPETGDFPAQLPVVEGLLECTSGRGLASEPLAVGSSTDIDNQKSPPHLIPGCSFDCGDLQQSELTDCGDADAKSPEGSACIEDDNCCHLLVNAAKSGEKGDMTEPFLDTKTISGPRKLFVKRKAISPTSQEKLCQAMDVQDLYDGLPAENRKQRMLFEKTKIALPEVCPEDAETLSKISFAGDSHLPSTHKNLSRKGILKSSCSPCIESCICRECASIRSYAQKAIDFSQRQMHDIECLASKLLRELKSLKTIVEGNLLAEPCLLYPNNRVDELTNATNTANEVEETTLKWLSMMSKDCNRFCKIMKKSEKKHAKCGSAQREQRRITFADEAGGLLCHVKVFQVDSVSLLEHADAADVAVAKQAGQCE